MAVRFPGVDPADPRLPPGVIAASVGTTADTLAAGDAPAAAVASRATIAEHDLRGWISAAAFADLSSGVDDNVALFEEVMADLKSWYDDDGLIHVVKVPAGTYAFSDRLEPPAGGCFGVRGEGMDRTIFTTSATDSWLGMGVGAAPGDTRSGSGPRRRLASRCSRGRPARSRRTIARCRRTADRWS